MSKKVTIISTSPRVKGNSDILADEFLRGAVDAGHRVEKIALAEHSPELCIGCLACQETGHCVIEDDVSIALGKMLSSDAVVFATPIYFYEMCGQMKTFLDRTNPLFPTDYAFRDIYLLATAAENADSAVDGAVKGLQGWLDCFDKTQLAGVVRGIGAVAAGDINSNSIISAEAYQMGKAI